MSNINWADVLRGSLAFFLVVVGLGIAYVCIRVGSLLARLARTVGTMTDQVVPILTRAQTTVDGINLELVRVDDIMISAVNATKGAEKTVSTISGAVAAPVRKASGIAAAAKEAFATFRTRRAAGPDEALQAAAAADQVTGEIPLPVAAAEPTATDLAAASFRTAAVAGGERFKDQLAEARAAADARVPAPPSVPSPAPLRDDVFAKHVRAGGSEPGDGNHVNGAAEAAPALTEPAIAGNADAASAGRRRGPSLSQISWALPKRGGNA